MLKNAASVSLSLSLSGGNGGGGGGGAEMKKGGLLGGGFGMNMRAEFGGMVHLRSLDLGEGEGGDYDREGRGGTEAGAANNHVYGNKSKRRLVVVGDVHGCIDECKSFSLFSSSNTYIYISLFHFSTACLRGFSISFNF